MQVSCSSLTVSRGVPAAIFMACLTGIAAQVRIPLPFTPVPLTGQVFAVLLSGLLLGARFGFLSQMIYVACGAVGIPCYAGFSFGPAVLLGPTGGYIIGFIPAVYVLGKLVRRNSLFRIIGPMMLAVLIIYIFGAAQFALTMHTGLSDTLRMAVIPFIGLDLAKAIAASTIGRLLS